MIRSFHSANPAMAALSFPIAWTTIGRQVVVARIPGSETVESIKLGASHVLRNPAVYTLFSRWGLVIGSGVYRAIRSIEAATGQEPVLMQQGNEFVFSIPRKAFTSS